MLRGPDQNMTGLYFYFFRLPVFYYLIAYENILLPVPVMLAPVNIHFKIYTSRRCYMAMIVPTPGMVMVMTVIM